MDKLLVICLSVLGLVSAQRKKSKFSNVRYDYNMVDEVCVKLASDFDFGTTSQAVLDNNQTGEFILIQFLL